MPSRRRRPDEVDAFQSEVWSGSEKVVVVGVHLGEAVLAGTREVEGVGVPEWPGMACRVHYLVLAAEGRWPEIGKFE